MTSTARLLVVDDDPLARGAVRAALDALPSVAIVAEGATGAAAIELIHAHAPDAVILDVHLPDLDGFAVVEAIGAANMPPIVFVTAFDHHAVQAFEVFAVDYVVKPFTDARLHAAVTRALHRRALEQADAAAGGLPALVRALDTAPAAAGDTTRRFLIRDAGRIRFLAVDDIDWLEADGNYVRLHAGGEAHSLRATLRATLEQLDPARFVRIHRSAAVNVDRVAEVQPWFGGDYLAILRDGSRLRVSRTYKHHLLPPR